VLWHIRQPPVFVEYGKDAVKGVSAGASGDIGAVYAYPLGR
jgi:hypothetical protein